ncbi:MAG: hypothetical protein FWF46_01735 [Oscillospiraceae bacterium]|nr:hypothetical protein [Oscillospiraceae bacterium]
MQTFTKFLYEFLSQFVGGILEMFKGIGTGFIQIFNINAYKDIIEKYKGDLSMPEWLLVGLSIFMTVMVVGMAALIILFLIRKYVKFRKKSINQEELLDEVASLNNQVVTLMKQKDEIMAMKVSQLGLKPGESPVEETAHEEEKEEDVGGQGIRFAKLNEIDEEYKNYKVKDYGNNFSLVEFCDSFRNFSAGKLKLYYSEEMIRLFVSAMSSTKLVILQGISGTGKTSLAYAWGKFLKNDSCVASVQPSWRDRTEIFGYFNEFTKKFNETEVLRELYRANYTNDIYTIILDEMNIARVEYYFAEMLSILEMPNEDEWIIELVPSHWKSDPVRLNHGKLKVPANLWYIGTINNDDSTFIVTDKVYDRAMPIDINEKGKVFKAKDIEPMDVNYTYLKGLFTSAMTKNQLSQQILDKVEEMDNYVIQHFRIAFGNRIVAHMRKFVPVYVDCGGTEVSGVDYFMAKKVLRKFEQLNVAYIRDEIDPFVEFLNKTFGRGAMKECIEYMLRLKKLT